ncbi:MAG: hydantoinase/oxoprolinase family protein [Methylococcales bacterium]
MVNYCMGWDIGGAHVKAAVINPEGLLVGVYQRPCPLWKGLEQLTPAVTGILQELPNASYRHGLTMTGELVDLFAHRDDGVKQIIAAMRCLLADDLFIFAGSQGLLPCELLNAQHYPLIASTNWLASAAMAAQVVGNGLFIDIGSTTTDLLVFKNNQVLAQGYTDYQRLLSQELVYTGVVRTAVMAVAQSVIFENREIGIMAEYFATMADVYRLTGELNEAHDQTDTADGAEKTPAASARRLARMIGCDFVSEQLPRWQCFASVLRAQQLQLIQRSCQKHLHDGDLSQTNPLIGAGIGRFLVKQLAEQLGYPYLDFSDICPQNGQQTSITSADCAPAVAVAQLAYNF